MDEGTRQRRGSFLGAGLEIENEQTLPDMLALTRSQALSLTALSNDEQRLRKDIETLNASLQATIAARVEVLEEIGEAHSVTVDEIGNNYQFDGKQLFKRREVGQ